MVNFEELKKQKQSVQPQEQKQNEQRQKLVVYRPTTGMIAVVVGKAKKVKYGGYLIAVKVIEGSVYRSKQFIKAKELNGIIALKIQDEELANNLQKGMVLVWNAKKAKRIILYEDGKK